MAAFSYLSPYWTPALQNKKKKEKEKKRRSKSLNLPGLQDTFEGPPPSCVQKCLIAAAAAATPALQHQHHAPWLGISSVITPVVLSPLRFCRIPGSPRETEPSALWFFPNGSGPRLYGKALCRQLRVILLDFSFFLVFWSGFPRSSWLFLVLMLLSAHPGV